MDRFSIVENGYNPIEVSNFIDEVIKNIEVISDKCELQKKEIIKLKSELEYYKNLEKKLVDAVSDVEKSCDELRENARNERDTIINDAKNNASVIVNEALLRAENIENNTYLVENNIIKFKEKFKNIIEQQIDIADKIDELELDI